MSKGSRAGAPTPAAADNASSTPAPTTATEAASSEASSETQDPAQGGGAGEAGAPDAAAAAGDAPPATPVPPVTERRRTMRSAKEALERGLGVAPPVAAFLLAYFSVRGELPEDLVEQAKRLQSLPQVWSTVLQGNYVGFRLACEFNGLPFVAPGELQAAVSAALTL